MSFKHQLDDLLNKEMDRKDFLKHLAIGATVLSGAGAALRFFAVSPTKKSVDYGIERSPYGGGKKIG